MDTAIDVQVMADADAGRALLDAVHELLVGAFAGDFPIEDWEHTAGGWRVVARDGGVPVAHAAVVPRRLHVAGRPLRTGYLEGVGTLPGREREGFGSAVVRAADELVREHFELGALSTSAHGFYERLGWERWQGPTWVRTDGREVRTPDEDGGIMVLRGGPSAGIDLTAPIACEARPGDDW